MKFIWTVLLVQFEYKFYCEVTAYVGRIFEGLGRLRTTAPHPYPGETNGTGKCVKQLKNFDNAFLLFAPFPAKQIPALLFREGSHHAGMSLARKLQPLILNQHNTTIVISNAVLTQSRVRRIVGKHYSRSFYKRRL